MQSVYGVAVELEATHSPESAVDGFSCFPLCGGLTCWVKGKNNLFSNVPLALRPLAKLDRK